jgi:hypothetical protein
MIKNAWGDGEYKDIMAGVDHVRGGVCQSYTQETIQEFEVIDAGYKAEFGRGSGG